MNNKWIHLCLMVLTVLTMTSCRKVKQAFKMTSTGLPYELLVVADQTVWKGPGGRAVYNILDSDMPSLPQSEPWFRIMYTTPDGFNSILKPVRNILFVDVNKTQYTKAKLSSSSDVYASPQAVLTIQAPTEAELITFVNDNKKAILEYFNRAEINIQLRLLEHEHSQIVSDKVKELFGCEIWAPTNIQSFKVGKDFFWASSNTALSDINLVIYSYPYTDKQTFTERYFLQKRDSVMKANIPGSKPGMYMTTDSLTLACQDIAVHGQYAFEVRGLWKVKGDMMGGPFVSHTRVDEVNGRIITAEIFVYSPDKAKRRLVRLMEATLFSLKLPAEIAKSAMKNSTIQTDSIASEN